jgi:hypothetical protein
MPFQGHDEPAILKGTRFVPCNSVALGAATKKKSVRNISRIKLDIDLSY